VLQQLIKVGMVKSCHGNECIILSTIERCIKADCDDNISRVACLDKTLRKGFLSFDKAKKKFIIEPSSSQKLDNKILEPVSKSDTRSSILVDCCGSYLKTLYVKVLSNEMNFK